MPDRMVEVRYEDLERLTLILVHHLVHSREHTDDVLDRAMFLFTWLVEKTERFEGDQTDPVEMLERLFAIIKKEEVG